MEFEQKAVMIQKALLTLQQYAGYLADEDLEGERDFLARMKRFSEGMASFFCVEGCERKDYDRLIEKYADPYDRLIAGDLPDAGERAAISEDDAETVMTALTQYRDELLENYEPVYDEDIELCDGLMEEIGKYYRDTQREILEKQQATEAAEDSGMTGGMVQEI